MLTQLLEITGGWEEFAGDSTSLYTSPINIHIYRRPIGH